MADHSGGASHAAGQNQAKSDAAATHAPAAHEPPEHGGVELGPIDWPEWIAGAIGVVAGLLVIASFYIAGRG